MTVKIISSLIEGFLENVRPSGKSCVIGYTSKTVKFNTIHIYTLIKTLQTKLTTSHQYHL